METEVLHKTQEDLEIQNGHRRNKTKRDLKMALDTGATYCLLPWKVADILGLHPEVSKDKVDMTTASGVVTVPQVTVDSITVTNKKANEVNVLVHDLPPKSYVDGLLGLSFLKTWRIKNLL